MHVLQSKYQHLLFNIQLGRCYLLVNYTVYDVSNKTFIKGSPTSSYMGHFRARWVSSSTSMLLHILQYVSGFDYHNKFPHPNTHTILDVSVTFQHTTCTTLQVLAITSGQETDILMLPQLSRVLLRARVYTHNI